VSGEREVNETGTVRAGSSPQVRGEREVNTTSGVNAG